MDEQLSPAEVNAYLSDSCEELQAKIMQMSDDPDPVVITKSEKRRRRRVRRARIYAERAAAFHARKDQLQAEEQAREHAEHKRERKLREQEKQAEKDRALQLFNDRMYTRARQYGTAAAYAS